MDYMNKKIIKVKSPATVSNLVCGFDILGLAIGEPYDIIELSEVDSPGISIVHHDQFGLTTDPSRNIAGVALQAVIDEFDIRHGFEINITKYIKPGSGIGSSAASAAGIVVAANELLDLKLTNEMMVKLAMEGEVLASGSKHADNLAPCIYGGLTLIRDTASLDIIKLPIPPLYLTVIHPQIEIRTSYAREILPKQVPLKDAAMQWANVGGLVAGMMKNDLDLISRSLKDFIIEPVRSKLIPGFNEVKQKCLEAGVLGGGISGSGPSMFYFSKDEKTAASAATIMKDIYSALGIDHKIYVTQVNDRGVEVI
jgi:homoserine kinase